MPQTCPIPSSVPTLHVYVSRETLVVALAVHLDVNRHGLIRELFGAVSRETLAEAVALSMIGGGYGDCGA